MPILPTHWGNLPPLFARERLHPAAIAQADRMLAEAGGKSEGKWCVAFSGGADSLALLLTVWTLWPERRSELCVLHFNHRLRGAESEADAVFCAEVCGEMGVEFHIGEWSDAKAGASEAEAREARLAFFETEMEAVGSRVLWTGHQKDDVAETLLMRIARGSGSAGLAAPRPVQTRADGRILLRPLLTLRKAEIVAALQKAGVTWREDASNAVGDFFRNRVRRDVMPPWRAAAGNDALGGAALTRELLDEDDAALNVWLAELLPEGGYDGDALDVRALEGKPRALWRRALRRWRPLAALGRAGFEEVLALCARGSGRTSAGEGVVEIGAGILRYMEKGGVGRGGWTEARLSVGTVLFLPDGGVLTMRVVAFTAELRRRIFAGQVDMAREAFLAEEPAAFCVRPWRTGDRYRPLGAPGSAALQDLFVNRKIPAARRGQLPVVIGEDGRILWVPGFPPAEESKTTSDSVTGLHLTYETGTCTVRL
ncbi:tRNA lysidine(34) synthetase TilS [Nibricoccus aquaticus]|uniref:tRNA(Ile)-lysidine synthase n=1 Tax=Nibricoccus aquaticus TaxID=2576891 RepID=A0A290QLG8_9BACT|nr:tRNA lysidine(34) synthetase TilS [Nibricoccus aquaticus]ATC65291.1 tRNA lysidine(34) synthetase TilS [Nibricoccus aquaticus]